MNTMEIARTIISQLKFGSDAKGATSGQHCMMCWAFREPAAMVEEKRGEDYQLGGLRFRVSGAKFKGLVFVRLMANDTYTIDFAKVNRKMPEVIKIFKTYNDVYCESLTELVDSYVESGQ